MVTVIGGAGAFLSLLGEGTLVAKVATLVLTVAGVIQAVFRIDTCAAQHRQWLKQWLEVLRQVRMQPKPEHDQIDAWVTERYRIEAECVGELRALQVDCYNRTIAALSLVGEPVPIRWWQRVFIQVWSFEGSFPG